MDFDLASGDRELLLAAARESIASRLQGREARRPQTPPALMERCGAFVTLHEAGRLRGCIGRMVGSDPLLETVSSMARAAAFEDPRFPPLSARELGEIDIEITVLSPLRDCCPDEVEVGRHGIYITKGWHSGVLLPQVATERCWDRETFLEQTCLKAGLPPDAWESPEARVQVFEGIVFGEKGVAGC
ncbi:MAG TPA: AmmeMemoRadiSam system protein A [Rectinemataceae bacterium]|nr:AmmeMemoRadiSam system protein A [Rectinemataceae bacterium]